MLRSSSRLPDTPFLAVDADVLERNLQGAAALAQSGAVSLRPHAKTHKVVQIARRQLELGAIGLTVATLGESEVFADAGFDDIFIAYPVWATPSRGARLREVSERAQLKIGIDSVDAIESLAPYVRRTSVRVMVEIDSGHHRSGVLPRAAGEIAVAAARAGLDVAGVFTFPGHAYAPGARAAAAEEEARSIAEAVAGIESHGLACDVRSGGSTPTLADSDPGVLTEVRPGVYVFNDAQQVELGTCSWSDVALTSWSTVVSSSTNTVILDSGSKVLGADQPAWVTGGGRLPDHPGARIVALSEHHATVAFQDGAEMPRRGDVVRVAPNHVCSAVNLADELIVVRQGVAIDAWPVAARGANQ